MSIPNIEIQYTKLFINNEFVDAVSGKTFPTINPANGKADVDLAVAAAKKAFARGSDYRKLDASARGKFLTNLANLFERDIEILAKLEAIDCGKTYKKAYGDVYGCIIVFRYFAGSCDKYTGKTVPADGGNFVYTRKEPVGIVGQIIPWNYPLTMLTWKWAPALVTGCTVVMKPAEQTSLSALHASALAKEAGVPAGVLNVICGYADSNLKKVSLELGGKSPLVVMDDFDVSEAAKIAHEACFDNQGQCCCAGTRTFVHEKIYDKFVAESARLARERNIGSQFDQTAIHGPQIDERMCNKVMGYIEAGQKDGAKLEAGGNRVATTGYFIEPTVFSDVTDNMSIATDEIFGPVQSILKFKTLEEVIERANNTNYGLAAGILTKNLDNALVFAHAVEAGTVWINCYMAFAAQAPFGGYKQSGTGRELSNEALELYQEIKTVSIKLPIYH